MDHTSWITRRSKNNFISDNIQTKAILFILGGSEVNRTWLITSELANQRARKVLFTCVVYTNPIYIITKSMRALWLVNQLWVIVPVNPRKNSASSESLYKSNRPKVSMGYLTNKEAKAVYYTVIKHDGHLRTRGKCKCFLHLSSVLKWPSCFITVQYTA